MKKIFTLCLLLIILLSSIKSPSVANAATFNINFDTNCESISLMNLDTDTIVYEKNPHIKRSPASITKIMTYIVVVENINDLEGTKVTVKNESINELIDTGSSIAELSPGEVFSVYQLLHAMMIASGNDAALVLADYVGNGDMQTFINMMNAKVDELGLQNTHFANSHGLYDPNHYTTTNDMIKITKYALTMPYFSEITNQTISHIMGSNWPLVTTNFLIDSTNGGQYYYKYARGIKTGHLDEAGYCLASTAVKGGYTYLCIAMGAKIENNNLNTINGAMIDSKALYMWAFKNLEIKTILNTEQPIGEVDLKYAYKKDKLMLVSEKDLSAVLPGNVEISSIEIVRDYPSVIKTPIQEGQKVGTATLYYANQPIATVNVVSGETVKRSQVLYGLSITKQVVTSKIFIIVVIIILILIGLYVLITIIQNKNKNKIIKKNKSKYKK